MVRVDIVRKSSVRRISAGRQGTNAYACVAVAGGLERVYDWLQQMAKANNDKIDPYWAQVGARIKEDRLAMNPPMGQAELGRAIGLQIPSSMHRYESGRAPIPIPRIERIAEVLGKRPERYMPKRNVGPKPKPLTKEQSRDLCLRLATAASEAARLQTPEAMESLNDVIAELVVHN